LQIYTDLRHFISEASYNFQSKANCYIDTESYVFVSDRPIGPRPVELYIITASSSTCFVTIDVDQ